MKEKPLLGGQALIEGVMIKSPNHVSLAVRKNKKKIVTKKEKLRKKNWFLKLFFIRGIVNLIEMLVIGTRALMWSAHQQAEEEGEELGKVATTITFMISMLFAIGLFVLLPYALTYLLGIQEQARPVLFNVVDGIIKVGILLLYLWLISFMKDVKTLFQYHGAEHKAVFCYEHNKALTVKNVQKYSTLHPRCGTAFLLMVIIIAIVIFAFIPSIIQALFPSFTLLNHWLQKLILFFTRILMLPIVAGLSYELLRLGAKYPNNILLKLFVQPGLWMQKITTKRPTNKQVEVAIVSLKNAAKLEKAKDI